MDLDEEASDTVLLLRLFSARMTTSCPCSDDAGSKSSLGSVVFCQTGAAVPKLITRSASGDSRLKPCSKNVSLVSSSDITFPIGNLLFERSGSRCRSTKSPDLANE